VCCSPALTKRGSAGEQLKWLVSADGQGWPYGFLSSNIVAAEQCVKLHAVTSRCLDVDFPVELERHHIAADVLFVAEEKERTSQCHPPLSHLAVDLKLAVDLEFSQTRESLSGNTAAQRDALRSASFELGETRSKKQVQVNFLNRSARFLQAQLPWSGMARRSNTNSAAVCRVGGERVGDQNQRERTDYGNGHGCKTQAPDETPPTREGMFRLVIVRLCCWHKTPLKVRTAG
jgi:hypothetical protein